MAAVEVQQQQDIAPESELHTPVHVDVVELARQNRTNELSRINPNSIRNAVQEWWPSRHTEEGLLCRLLSVGSKSDWHNHFFAKLVSAYGKRSLFVQESRDVAGSAAASDEPLNMDEAIALEIVKTCPELLTYNPYDESEVKVGSQRPVVHLGAAQGSARLFSELLAFAKTRSERDTYLRPFGSVDHKGYTPLSLAVQREDRDRLTIIQALLKGTKVEIDELSWRDATGQQPGCALGTMDEDALLLFMEHRSASVNDLLIKCAMRRDRLFQRLLSIKDNHTWHNKLLFLAVEARNLKAIESLLLKFPELAIAEKDGKSVLCFVSKIADDPKIKKDMRAAIVPHLIRQVEEEARRAAAEPKNTPDSSLNAAGDEEEEEVGSDKDDGEGDAEDDEEDDDDETGPVSTTERIRALLADSPADRREISLDLAGFKRSKQPIEHLLSMVDKNPEAEHLPPADGNPPRSSSLKPTLSVNFESTLSFVDIPVPDLPLARATTPVGVPIRDEVLKILGWLHDENQVQGIYQLRVRDSLYIPHSEEVIQSCLGEFDIEVLDWQRVDLSLKPLVGSCKNLKQLRLYASSWAALQYWTSREAVDVFLEHFPKIASVTIIIVEDLVGKQLSKNYRTIANDRLDHLLPETPETQDPPAARILARGVFKVEIQAWPVVGAASESSHSVVQTTVLEATQLAEFLPKYKILQRSFADKQWLKELGLHAKKMPYTKVAVIDTGVDPGSIQCTRIRGASFIPSGGGGGESPWWFSQYPHGTQVAKIITEIDPFCELLVAKVGDAHRDMTTQRVVEAFRWAIKCDADIISMSATIKPSQTLREVVMEATAAGIVVLGSSTGEGYVDEEAWPANCKDVLSIGAAKPATGKETSGSVRDNARYMFPGKNLLVRTSFLGSPPWETEVSGTSFATAAAAGVASLVLACRHLALSTQNKARRWRSNEKFRGTLVEEMFIKMSRNKGKYVKPWVVFHQDEQQPRWGEAHSILGWVSEEFLDVEGWP